MLPLLFRLSTLITAVVTANPVTDNARFRFQRALAASGLLQGSSCVAIFVGARWVGDAESPLTQGSLGAHFGSDLSVTSFEADEAECQRQTDQIARRPAEQRISREVCVGAVLSDLRRSGVPFYVTEARVCSSLLPPNVASMRRLGLDGPEFRCSTVEKTITVDTTVLDAHVVAGGVDYARLDVQGADLAVLRGGTAALGEILALQIEVEFVELYQGQPLFAEVDTYVRQTLGLTFMGLTDQSNIVPTGPHRSRVHFARDRGQLIHADALYLRLDLLHGAPESLPWDATRAERLVLLAGLASTMRFYGVIIEILDFLLRWEAAELCVRIRAARAMKALLLSAEAEGAAFVAARGGFEGDAWSEAEALLLLRQKEATCGVTGDGGGAVEVEIVIGGRASFTFGVGLREGEAPRARAWEFCRRHAYDPLEACVEALEEQLRKDSVRDASMSEIS
jgi:hypothetical protein